jgi:NAD+ diphosphatase
VSAERPPAAGDAEAAWELGGLALARGEVDRATARRSDADWVSAAWADPRTRVLPLAGGQAPVRFGDAGAELALVTPAEAPDGLRFLLGVDDSETAFFGIALPAESRERVAALAQAAGGDARLAGLREAGPVLGDRDAGLLTHAVALANWHGSHTHCPRCGAVTGVQPGGHSRVCPVDGSEHFPRIDPAVIMLVTDQSDRCLLARNRNWPERRVSILAGFVEPGESAEQAVVREVREETGITAGEVRYVGSQPWPMPQSLMLGFRARAADGQRITVDDEEIAEARFYSRAGLRAAMAEGELRLPPPVSIAHQIIQACAVAAPREPGRWPSGGVGGCQAGASSRTVAVSSTPGGATIISTGVSSPPAW